MPKSPQPDGELYSRFSDNPCDIPAICLVDTNVFLGAGPHIQDWNKGQLECSFYCLKVMNWIAEKTIQKIVLDGTMGASEIFKEYCHQLNPYGGQSLAEQILRQLLTEGRFLYRKVTKTDGKEYEYAEFPKHHGLQDFDGSDRKFVAVANAEEPHLPILQSMDGKWWRWAKPLHEIGIEILFNHPEYARENCKDKNSCDKDDCSECEL
jgi:hypothetical protein